MDRIDRRAIEKLRRLGMTESLADGAEAVRVTAQYSGRPSSPNRKAWTERLTSWERQIADDAGRMGAELVEGSLSVSGQTVELLVPITRLESLRCALERDEVRVRLLEEHDVDPSSPS